MIISIALIGSDAPALHNNRKPTSAPPCGRGKLVGGFLSIAREELWLIGDCSVNWGEVCCRECCMYDRSWRDMLVGKVIANARLMFEEKTSNAYYRRIKFSHTCDRMKVIELKFEQM